MLMEFDLECLYDQYKPNGEYFEKKYMTLDEYPSYMTPFERSVFNSIISQVRPETNRALFLEEIAEMVYGEQVGRDELQRVGDAIYSISRLKIVTRFKGVPEYSHCLIYYADFVTVMGKEHRIFQFLEIPLLKQRQERGKINTSTMRIRRREGENYDDSHWQKVRDSLRKPNWEF
jgi:hypothetical protein